MLIGYARVSTGEQETAAQVAALKAAGCELIFCEKAPGSRWDRPELHRLLSQLRKGDVLVVWKLDRLSRSLRDVLTIMERVQERKADFRSLTEAVDTTTPAGRMMMQMVGSFADYAECTIMRSRWAEVALRPAYQRLGTPHNTEVRCRPIHASTHWAARDWPTKILPASPTGVVADGRARCARFLQPPLVPTSSFGSRPGIMRSAAPMKCT